MDENYFNITISSKKCKLLDQLIGKKITKMTRYSWWNKYEAVKECEIDREDVFSLTSGPLALEYESNITVCFNSDVEYSSIIMWVENMNGQTKGELLEDDDELFPIQSDDVEFSIPFFANIIGQSMTKYEIIKKETTNPLQWDHPREVGLVLFFSNGAELILGHQLSNAVSDDFTVLQWHQIDQERIYPYLYKMSKFW